MVVKLNRQQEERFLEIAKPYLDDDEVNRMKAYIAHGAISVYDHCLNVAKNAFYFNDVLKLKGDEDDLVAGGILHDFYLYDWHDASIGFGFDKLHGYTHPGIACKNAVEHFAVDAKVQEIIRCHMWPLTLRSLPRSREAIMICLCDKFCALKETLFQR